MWLTLDAGRFESIEVNSKTGAVRVGLSAATEFTPTARLRIEQPAKIKDVGKYHSTQPLKQERDALVVPLKKGVTWVDLQQ
jgi:Family of unknown function (DUF5695)